MRARLLTAAGIAAVAAAHPTFRTLTGRSKFSDFIQTWMAGFALLRGIEPYAFVQRHFAWPFYYPLTAGVIGIPFTAFRLGAASIVWVALSFGVLAFALTKRAWWPLLALASYPAVHAMRYAQWSPLLTAAALLPSLAWLAVAKPSTGLAIGAAYLHRVRPRWRVNALIAGLIVAVSFAVDPSWPIAWRAALAGNHHLIPMIVRPGAVFVLLALFRWRRPEARLLVALTIVPASVASYELLPIIALVPTSRLEMLILAVCSYLAVPFLDRPGGSAATFAAELARQAPLLLATTYLPALAMILTRPNVPDDT